MTHTKSPARSSGGKRPLRVLTRAFADWPAHAPSWADHATEERGSFAWTFEREWTVPGLYRDAPSLSMVRVTQDSHYNAASNDFTFGPIALTVGDERLWQDERVAEVAATLRAIADALVPLPLPLPTAGDAERDARTVAQ